MTRGEQILLGACMIFIMIGMASVVVAYTVEPMVRNYKQCGTIFLCSGQRGAI